MSRMIDDPSIDASRVAALVSSQFPQWAGLPVTRVVPGGWDNRSFRLGEALVVRLPSSAAYSAQVEKEHRWLPVLAPLLPLAIPRPVGLGEPTHGYPWRWAIREWIEGDTAAQGRPNALSQFAEGIGRFLDALHRIDSRDAPPPGPDNFFRGGPLATYDGEARRAMQALDGRIDMSAATQAWEEALSTEWRGKPVWVHGDMSAGNLLVRDGELCGVIDFGQMAVGDPACDLAIAWTFLTAETRAIFRSAARVDDDTWNRGRGWALWKASMVAAKMAATNAVEEEHAWRTMSEILQRP